ncbi:hypothetical protein ACFLR8_01460 [Bacteroidota bacterium]
MSKELSSRYLYIYKDKSRGSIWGATNMRTLSRKSGINYGKLRYWFDQQSKDGVEFDAFRIDRLLVSLIFNKADKQ